MKENCQLAKDWNFRLETFTLKLKTKFSNQINNFVKFPLNLSLSTCERSFERSYRTSWTIRRASDSALRLEFASILRPISADSVAANHSDWSRKNVCWKCNSSDFNMFKQVKAHRTKSCGEFASRWVKVKIKKLTKSPKQSLQRLQACLQIVSKLKLSKLFNQKAIHGHKLKRNLTENHVKMFAVPKFLRFSVVRNPYI